MKLLKGLALAFGVLISTFSQAQVVINEFMADNVSYIGDQNGEFDDWIEIYNNGSSSISLTGWFLSDDAANKAKWKFPNTTIPAGGYIVVWADQDVLQSGLHANFKLSKGGESIFLSRTDTISTDSIDYSAQLSNVSQGRFPNGIGPHAFLSPTIGVMNTPMAPINPVAWHKLVINEIMAANDTVVSDQDSEFDPWIEIYNTSSTETISLFGLFLSQDRAVKFGSALKDTVILPNQFLIVWVDGNNKEEGLHSAFPLVQEGSFFGLVNANGTYVDSLEYNAQPRNVSFKRLPNGTGSFTRSLPSFSTSNTLIALTSSPILQGEIVLNEFMSDNTSGMTDQNSEFEDWAELYNSSSRSINLKGFYLSDDLKNPFKWQFADTIMPPNTYLITWLDNDVLQSGVHANFKLSTLGEDLVMCWPNDYVVDSITFAAQHLDTAMARIPNASGQFYFSLPTHNAYNSQGSIQLPVDLLDFRVKAEHCKSVIEWFTTNEIGIENYVVQRSAKGDLFEDIDVIRPQSSVGINQYTFADEMSASKYAFYRIKIQFVTGDHSYSEAIPVSVNCGDKAQHLVFPNPVKGMLYWRSWNISTPRMTVELKDVQGRTVLSQAIVHEDGSLFSANVGDLQNGVYMIRFLTENYVRTKFIVVRN